MLIMIVSLVCVVIIIFIVIKVGGYDFRQHGGDAREFVEELKSMGKGSGKGKDKGKDKKDKGDEPDEPDDDDDDEPDEPDDEDDNEEDSDMQVFVQTPEGKTITLDVEASDTIATVKTIIKNKIGFLKKDQRLLFKDTQLEDSCTLIDYNIQNEDMLTLAGRLRGGAPKKRQRRAEDYYNKTYHNNYNKKHHNNYDSCVIC